MSLMSDSLKHHKMPEGLSDITGTVYNQDGEPITKVTSNTLTGTIDTTLQGTITNGDNTSGMIISNNNLRANRIMTDPNSIWSVWNQPQPGTDLNLGMMSDDLEIIGFSEDKILVHDKKENVYTTVTLSFKKYGNQLYSVIKEQKSSRVVNDIWS